MKKTLVLLTVSALGLNVINARNELNVIRIGETNPSTSAYVFGTGEQLSGQQFQTEGIKTYKGYQYTVYYNLTRNVCIARRKMPAGKWEEVKLPYQNAVDDAHNTISMGICENDGSIHLSYDHHNDALHYCYSIAGSANDPENMPWEASSFSATTDIMDKAVENVTYPRFISKPDGNLLFECRFRWSGFGDSYIREYDAETKKWSLVGRYVQGEDNNPTACAYINGMTYDHLGRMHVTWCWRDDFGGGTNHDFYYAYSEDDGRTWKDTYGVQNAVTELMDPVYSNVTGSCLGQSKKSFMIEAIPYNKGYINQETQAVDSKGRIHAVNSHIPGSETDSNWGTSRTKARLHHRFRDTDGTWKTVQVKNNGETVNSYCRVNLSFDAFDNAFVVANGAEVYTASSANGYDDWDLVSDTDKGRFLSEPLVDRSLLQKEGVLSFVYLGADNKITVIDYLLDNPNTPAGAGLTAEYFSESGLENQSGAAENVSVSTSDIPEGTKSIRWSGSFETSYAESYTMYLNTDAAAEVYVDGVKVLLTRKSDEAKEYSFSFGNIASHKHNIVITAEAGKENEIALSWSSKSVEKQLIPAAALYSSEINENPTENSESEPELPRKPVLDKQLSGAQSITGRVTIPFASFNPAGDYTLELKAKVLNSFGCGLVLEGRSASGRGIRISIDETSVKWMAAYDAAKLLTVADNAEEQAFRIAVKGDKAYIYIDGEYIASADIAEIGDINEAGEEVMPAAATEAVELAWAGPNNKGTGKPTDYGWDNSLAVTSWNTANGGSGVRYLDVTSGHTYNGANYTGRLMTIRWDGTYGTYSYPVTLEANTNYEFSMLYEWWNNGTGVSISTGISTNKDGSNMLGVKSHSVSSRNVLQKGVFNFTTGEAGTYYLIFNGQSGVMYGIGELELKKLSYEPKLTLSRYCDGNADISVSSLTYEDGAYAPGINIADVELENKESLSFTIVQNLNFAGAAGSKDIVRYPFTPEGDYSLEIAATVAAAEGRGMDFEVRDEYGMGFRTSLNDREILLSSPFAESTLLSASENNEQIMRYAVKDDKVYVYRNGEFVRSFAKQQIGDMNASGTSEESAFSNTPVNSENNILTNPDFSETADNAAPAGWTSNGSIGGGTNARVQLKSSTTELSAYPDGHKAFLIRFDGSYQWFSNKVTLNAGTWYEYSCDVISWGTNTDKTLNLMVSTKDGGEGDVMATEQISTPAVRATGEKRIIRFKTGDAGTYYITFAKGGTLAGTTGLTDQCLTEYNVGSILAGKNYTEGNAPVSIRYIAYDPDGAFAQTGIALGVETGKADNNDVVILTKKSELIVTADTGIRSVTVNDLSGRNVMKAVNCTETFSAKISSGIYIVTVVTSENETVTQKIIVQ